MADENEVKALIARFWDVRQKLTADTPETKFWAIVAREALRWRDETRPVQAPPAAVPHRERVASALKRAYMSRFALEELDLGRWDSWETLADAAIAAAERVEVGRDK